MALAAALLAASGALGALPAHAAAGCPSAGGAPQPADDPGSPTADVVVHGHGFGHGMGMSQYGAQGAALLGCSAGTVLRTYYPGLQPASRPLAGLVLVDLLDRGGDAGRAEVTAEGGAVTWRAGDLSAQQPRGSTWTVRRSGSGLVVRSGTASTSPRVVDLDTPAAGTLRVDHTGVVTRTVTYSSSGSVWLTRRSDGDWTRFTGGDRGLSVREVLQDDSRGRAVQKYLRGLAEMPLSWPLAAQEAQVVAARTYLVGKYSAAEGGYVVLPTMSDQVWKGYDQQQDDARYGGTLARAVADTTSGSSGTVLVTAGGAVARDVLYSSSDGGWSESNAYVWGSAPVGHLRQVDDSRWDAASSNPYRSWTVDLSYAQVARAFAFDQVTGITVGARGSADRTAVVVTGVRGGTPTTTRYTGQQARDRLATVDPAVRSSGFTFTYPTRSAGQAISGDWDGDGLDEVGWWNDGVFTLRSRDGSARRVAFGPPDGVPVVGDWDGDGRDSVGSFTSGTWLLGDASSSGAVYRRTTFGRAGDVPVAGAWAGGDVDGIGVVRGRTWVLREAVSGGDVVTRAFGRPGDRPVVGDWDGDGVDQLGVRRANRWFLAGAPGAPATTVVLGRATDSGVAGAWAARDRDLPGVGRDGAVHVATAPPAEQVQRWVVIG